jgi:hypothetical protein
MRNLLLPLLVLATALTAAACSSSDDASTDPSLADGTDQEQAGATKLTEAKLYSDPNASPNPSCDTHTALTVLKARSGKLIIELENRVGGACEIFVAPDKRSYTVTESESCGSKILKGTKNGDSVELQDNRTRMCEDIRPSILELKEKRGGREVALYGKPLASQQPGGGGGAASQLLKVKLYDEPHAQVNQGCDKHTELTLSKEGNTMKARLEYKLSATSGCEIFIAPNEKIFTVTASEDCGSKVYSGSAGGESIKIQDHTTRLCENVIPARIEVEWNRGGQPEHLYTTE